MGVTFDAAPQCAIITHGPLQTINNDLWQMKIDRLVTTTKME